MFTESPGEFSDLHSFFRLHSKRFAISKNIAGSKLTVIGDERKKESELSEPGTEARKNTKNFL